MIFRIDIVAVDPAVFLCIYTEAEKYLYFETSKRIRPRPLSPAFKHEEELPQHMSVLVYMHYNI